MGAPRRTPKEECIPGNYYWFRRMLEDKTKWRLGQLTSSVGQKIVMMVGSKQFVARPDDLVAAIDIDLNDSQINLYPAKTPQARAQMAVNDLMEAIEEERIAETAEIDLTEEEIAMVIELGFHGTVQETLEWIEVRKNELEAERSIPRRSDKSIDNLIRNMADLGKQQVAGEIPWQIDEV